MESYCVGPHLEDADAMSSDAMKQLGYVALEQFGCLELMAPEEHVPTECELTATASGFGVVGYQNGVAVVVRATETRVDDSPTVMSHPPKERTDGLGVDILVEHETHLGNR